MSRESTLPASSARSTTPLSTVARIWRRPGLLADRRGAGAAELDAVVLRRVVARGEHRGGRVEPAGGEVREVGRSETEGRDVGAGERDALGERLGKGDRRRAHVARDEDARRTGEPGEGVPDLPCDGLVDLVRVHAPNVVGLEDGVERHRCHSSADGVP